MNICSSAHEHMFFGGGNICYLAYEHMFVSSKQSFSRLGKVQTLRDLGTGGIFRGWGPHQGASQRSS